MRGVRLMVGAASAADLRIAIRDDPDVRDRLIAGAMVPVAWIAQAQKFRRRYRNTVLRLFEEVDAIIAPATPFVCHRSARRPSC
jgi:Asp-tRNA(Asn)/Glu-tRNA(Gln) amidotransferase A subunit family amidase